MAIFFVTRVLAQSPTSSEKIEVNGVELYYEVYGSGKPLLLIHGWSQSSQFWKAFIEEYASDFQVYAIDMRGHGKSTPLDDSFSIREAAKDVESMIIRLKLEKVKAIGLSFGALVLLELVNAQSDIFESMVLIGGAYNYSGKDNEAMKDFKFEDLPESFVQQLQKTHPQGEEQVRALFNPDLDYEIRMTEENLKSINTKVLIICGDRDEIVGIDQSVQMHELLPNSQLWVIPNTGHIAIGEGNRTEWMKTTKTFLTESSEN